MNPHNKDQSDKIEMVQRRAARYVTNRHHNTSSVGSMLQHLGWEKLSSRRKKLQLMMLFKISNGLVDIPADLYLSTNDGRTRAGNKNTFKQQRARTDTLNHSFFPAAIKLWNSLPAVVAEAPDLKSFKQELSHIKM
jgi:hypothetical protein